MKLYKDLDENFDFNFEYLTYKFKRVQRHPSLFFFVSFVYVFWGVSEAAVE